MAPGPTNLGSSDSIHEIQNRGFPLDGGQANLECVRVQISCVHLGTLWGERVLVNGLPLFQIHWPRRDHCQGV